MTADPHAIRNAMRLGESREPKPDPAYRSGRIRLKPQQIRLEPDPTYLSEQIRLKPDPTYRSGRIRLWTLPVTGDLVCDLATSR
jgi:hypothetical protein